MEYTKATMESLKIQPPKLNTLSNQNHIWKNMIKIEQLKKQHLQQKELLLRKTLQS